MSHESNSPSSVEEIYRSVEEIHALLSALEAQVKSGLFSSQFSVKTPEAPEGSPFRAEDGSFLTHWF
jgi:hypothetical protein